MKGLLTDFGGVLTTNVFDSFKAFCEAEGLPQDTVKRTFRDNPEALAELRALERGDLTVEEFEITPVRIPASCARRTASIIGSSGPTPANSRSTKPVVSVTPRCGAADIRSSTAC